MNEIESQPESEYLRQLIIVMSLLGGIAFAGLILVLSNSTVYKQFPIVEAYGQSLPPQSYFAAIVGLLSFTSIFSLIGSVAASRAVISVGEGFRELDWFAKLCMAGAVLSFLFVLPLALVPFDLTVANDLLYLVIILLFVLVVLLIGVKKRK